ncbi:hypothetical protein B0H13DRAFT_1962074 [Mycena leptocephala]|nr:hypothetical protein B0H13DRAFT_1962074 [Mycena leptocephala]
MHLSTLFFASFLAVAAANPIVNMVAREAAVEARAVNQIHCSSQNKLTFGSGPTELPVTAFPHLYRRHRPRNCMRRCMDMSWERTAPDYFGCHLRGAVCVRDSLSVILHLHSIPGRGWYGSRCSSSVSFIERNLFWLSG